MNTEELERLFKASIQNEETHWQSETPMELISTVIEDKHEWTQIAFAKAPTPSNESKNSSVAFWKTSISVVLWIEGAILLYFAVKDLLGY